VARDGWRHARIADLPALGSAGDPGFWRDWARDPGYGRRWHSVGRGLGVEAFGVNANEADAGEELVVPHDELEFGGQEELYLVARGRARFVCAGEAVELAPGEALVVDGDIRREATALEDGTIVVMIGAVRGEAYEIPEWNRG
jgi:mannose-6-phosphate isomerase-like protein (cupin superfamily)